MVGYEKTRKSGGFTLVEISIAVAVISVIVGLAITRLSTSKSDTQTERRKALITSIETAKNRYILSNEQDVTGQPAQLQEIAPYLKSEGQPINSLFDLIEGTGRPTNDLNLGNYKTQAARFNSDAQGGGNTISDPNTPPFDVNNPAEAYEALNRLSGMNSNDPEYQEILDLLNQAVDAGTISDTDFADAGLTEYNGTWMNNQTAQETAALDAQNILTSGGNWNSLSPQQKTAYANSFPQEAVNYGGTSALNTMNPSLITPSMVSMYVNSNGTWVSPRISSGVADNSTLPIASSWGATYTVVRITDPLQPAQVVGTINVTPVTMNGMFYGGYYSFNQTPGTSGLNVQTSPSNFGQGAGSYNITSINGNAIRILAP
jgi:prepilin-type N-terminal cleavage/methylation domain-containing protein